MYENIGKKIKGLAYVICILGAIASILYALTFLRGDTFVLGFIMMFVGPLSSWISSWLIYGFGELIDKTCDIAKNISDSEEESDVQLEEDIG